jgi:dUTP pyrophosphatase
MSTMKMQVKLLHPDAKVPVYAHETDAGMDLFSLETRTIAPRERVQVKTGIAVAIPDGYVGLIWDKSGLSHKHGLKVLGGVVDAAYRGEILVGLVNLGDISHTIKKGDKITQMLVQKVEHPELVVVDSLDLTVRGEGGFGSTGK